MSGKSSKMAVKRLLQEFRELTSNGVDSIVAGPVTEDDLFLWEAVLEGPSETPFDGGVFLATLRFPSDYPLSPPVMRFVTEMWHPNVYKDGTVCCSILHSPSDPFYSEYELPSEQWSPIQSVEKVLLSVVSMLAEPNDQSPANVDAAIQYRQNRKDFESKVGEIVKRSIGFA
ncbi:hypothetical protein BASA81_000952 [Batrachochytrium salamandrivorans]|nr:hypothetical protein BASA81_000952 [Batrachochytrium salamandrivorans]